jgi:hypothetical protein
MYEQVVARYGRLDVVLQQHGTDGSRRSLRAGHQPRDLAPGARREPDQHLPFPAGTASRTLASDDSGFITAAALPLDGGITEAFTVPE